MSQIPRFTVFAAAFSVLCCASIAQERPSDSSAPLVAPPADFTFKKLAPPAPGTTRRITVQIYPEAVPVPAQIAPQTPEPLPEAPVETTPSHLTAFWEATGTELYTASAARFLDASEFIASPGGQDVAAPELAHLQRLATEHGRTLLASTLGTRVSPALALSVIAVESSGRAEVVSSKGAQGLMQLIPATAERFGVSDPFDPAQNIAGGVKYLDWLIETFNGDAILALAGYNAGENAVKGAGGVPDYAETRAYVPKVMAAWRVARGLCLTPPDLASDGCVFVSMGTN